MADDECMKVKHECFPEDIRKRHDLQNKVTTDGHACVRIKKGMCGLEQAAILAHNHSKNNSAQDGCTPIPGTIGMWRHHTRPTRFCVCVDDFGTKYFSKEDAEHLLTALGKNCKCTTDWTGKNCCGLNISWNCEDGHVDVAMIGHTPTALKRLQCAPKMHPQHSPHRHIPMQFGKKGTRQCATTPDTSPLLTKKETTHIQSITGTFLHCGRAIDCTTLPALNELARTQAQPTQQTNEVAQQLMDYLNACQNAFLRHCASNMAPHVDSDAAHLAMPKAKSRIAGHFYLSDHPNKTKHPKLNAAAHVECKTTRHVVSSAAEAEVAGVCHNATMAIPMRQTLEALNHPQPPTPLKTDNSTATGFAHDNVHQKRSKAWDMRCYWLRDRQAQQQFKIHWDSGKNDEADHHTKHHPTIDHRTKRTKHIKDK